jgi:hypothetical protein
VRLGSDRLEVEGMLAEADGRSASVLWERWRWEGEKNERATTAMASSVARREKNGHVLCAPLAKDIALS